MRTIQSNGSTTVCSSSSLFLPSLDSYAYQRTHQWRRARKSASLKILLLDYCRFLYSGGSNPRPADLYDYRRTGRLPATDRAVLRGAPLCVADEDDDKLPSKAKPKYSKTKIHGQLRWEPCLDISGACYCSIEMDANGRVDLEHDAYCLRKHFSTRWAVPCDPDTAHSTPKPGATVSWGDGDMVLQTEGKESDGLWVDIKEKSWRRGLHEKVDEAVGPDLAVVALAAHRHHLRGSAVYGKRTATKAPGHLPSGMWKTPRAPSSSTTARAVPTSGSAVGKRPATRPSSCSSGSPVRTVRTHTITRPAEWLRDEDAYSVVWDVRENGKALYGV